jgi:hypothetical protein
MAKANNSLKGTFKPPYRKPAAHVKAKLRMDELLMNNHGFGFRNPIANHHGKTVAFLLYAARKGRSQFHRVGTNG